MIKSNSHIYYSIIYIFLVFNLLCYKIIYAEGIVLNGKVKVYKDNEIGMMMVKLIKKDGEEVILGTPGNMSNDAIKCINDAEDNNYDVSIQAQYAYDGIDDRTIVCKILNNNINPEIFGIYLGMNRARYLNILDNLVKINRNENLSVYDNRILTDGSRMLIAGVFNNNDKLIHYTINKKMFNLEDLRVESFLNRFKQYRLIKKHNKDGVYYSFNDGNIKIFIYDNIISIRED